MHHPIRISYAFAVSMAITAFASLDSIVQVPQSHFAMKKKCRLLQITQTSPAETLLMLANVMLCNRAFVAQ